MNRAKPITVDLKDCRGYVTLKVGDALIGIEAPYDLMSPWITRLLFQQFDGDCDDSGWAGDSRPYRVATREG